MGNPVSGATDRTTCPSTPRSPAESRLVHSISSLGSTSHGLATYRADIDGLRAIAIFLVVGFHAFPDRFRGGFIGVDIFFVISGFLISALLFNRLHAGNFSFINFFARRIKRLFPSLLAVLTACLVFGWFAVFPDEYALLGKHTLSGAAYISNLTLWAEAGYFDAASENKPLMHLWSLGVEEQFYLAFPVLLWLIWKFARLRLALILLFAVASYFYGATLLGTDVAGAYFSPFSRFWELMLGSALAYIQFRRETCIRNIQHSAANIRANLASALGAAILILATISTTKHTPFPGFRALLPTLGTALLLWAGPVGCVNRWVLSLRPVIGLGLISYPLYLWHWPLISFASVIESGAPPAEVRIVLVLAAVALAWLSYALLERPARFGPRSRFFPVWLLLFSCGLGAVGYWIDHRGGLPDRSIAHLYRDNRHELARTASRDAACLAYLERTAPRFDYCRRHDVGARETVALIGDSHAHAAFPGMARMLQDEGYNTVMLANSSCPPFPGAEHGATPALREECAQRTRQLLDALLTRPDIRRVVIFTRGPVYLTGKEFQAREVQPRLLIEPERFSASLQHLTRLLTGAGKQAFYITENPEMPILPSRCIQRPFRMTTSECTMSAVMARERQANYLDLVSKIQGLHVFSTLDLFCPDGVCRFMSPDGELLYADADHLSTAGSRFQAEALRAALFRSHSNGERKPQASLTSFLGPI